MQRSLDALLVQLLRELSATLEAHVLCLNMEEQRAQNLGAELASQYEEAAVVRSETRCEQSSSESSRGAENREKKSNEELPKKQGRDLGSEVTEALQVYLRSVEGLC